MKRKRSKSTIVRDVEILKMINEEKGYHPFWGYRRIWAYLKYRKGITISKNRIYRIMKENNLLVTKNAKLKAKRCSTRPKPRADKPNQYWGIDMTKIMILGFGWLYLHIVLDWFTKEIIGFSLSERSRTSEWLDSLNMAVNTRFPEGIKEVVNTVHLISDNGSQPTSEKFMKECRCLNIKQIFTTWNNPKGNSDTERVMRTIKEDAVWPYEWNNQIEFGEFLKNWIKDYNEDFPHQTLKYLTPKQYFEKFKEAELRLAS